jgi:hypothetical protein
MNRALVKNRSMECRAALRKSCTTELLAHVSRLQFAGQLFKATRPPALLSIVRVLEAGHTLLKLGGWA